MVCTVSSGSSTDEDDSILPTLVLFLQCMQWREIVYLAEEDSGPTLFVASKTDEDNGLAVAHCVTEPSKQK